MDILIRQFKRSDIDQLITLFRKSVREGAGADYSIAQRLAWAPDQIDREIWLAKRSSHPTYIALYQEEIAGFSDLKADGHINMLYVHPNFQRLGIATALLRTIEADAQKLALQELYTEASITARPIFEKMGFCVLAQQTVTQNGQDFTNFKMRKYI